MSAPPQEVEVFWLNTAKIELLPEQFLPLLSTAERNRAARYCLPREQNRFIIRRAALRQILSRRLKLSPAKIEIKRTQFGKPFVADSDVKFSCSQSHDFALFAIASAVEVGCDIERIDAALACPAVAAKYFSPDQCNELDQTPASDWQDTFFLNWTRLEAVLKARGTGFKDDSNASALRPDSERAHLFRIAPDYCACVVTIAPKLLISDSD